jgi:hypothetical protein
MKKGFPYVACAMLLTALLLVSRAAIAEGPTATDLGAQQLTANSAIVQVKRLRNELCDVLQYLHDLKIGDGQCSADYDEQCKVPQSTENPAGAGTPCPAEDTHDLAPSDKLLTKINDGSMGALLAFQRFVEMFCEQDGSLAELALVVSCWSSIPSKLEAVRLASERLYMRAAEGDGDANDDATRLVRQEGERSLLALAVLGRQWAQAQFIAPAGAELKADVQLKCSSNKLTTFPPEIDEAYRQLAQLRTGEKLRRAVSHFKDIEGPIVRAADALTGDISTSGLDRFCELAAAVDARTNNRFEQFLTQPDRAVQLSIDAMLVATHRGLLCKGSTDADKAGLCQPEPGDNTTTFSNYLRSSLRSWNKAQKALKDELARLDAATFSQRLMEDQAWANIHAKPEMLRASVIIINLVAERLPIEERRGVDASDTSDTRSLLGRLATRLGAPAQDQISGNDHCTPIGVAAVLKDADSLAADLVQKLRAIDHAVGEQSKENDATKPRTAEQMRSELIGQAKALLTHRISSLDLGNVGAAVQQLALLAKPIKLGELSASGGLAFSAALQSICLVNHTVKMTLALGLDARSGSAKQDSTLDAGRSQVFGASLSLPLRRSFAATFDLSEFQSALIKGEVEQTLKALLISNVPHEFTVDIAELCTLAAMLSPETVCHWPSAIPLPAGARVTLDSDFKRASIELPDWLKTALPEDCLKPMVVAPHVSVASTLACFNAELKRAESITTEFQASLRALLGEQFDHLRADASTALSAAVPKPLADLIASKSKFASCVPTVDIVIAVPAKDSSASVLEYVRRSVAIVDRPISGKADVPAYTLPDQLPLMEVRAELSVASCLNELVRTDITDRRMLGIWRETRLKWSRVLQVKLPKFAVATDVNTNTKDPLTAWDRAFAAFRSGGSSDILIWDESHPPETAVLEREAFASSLLISDHFELCRGPGGKGEELRFWMPALTSKDKSDLPCAMPEAGPGFVVATGEDFRSLETAKTDALLSSISGKLGGELALKLRDSVVLAGASSEPSADARACAGPAIGAPNTISFNISAASFLAAGSKHTLDDLQVIVGWQDKQPANIAFLARQPLERLGDVVGSVAGAPRSSVKIVGFVVSGRDIQPCIAGPKPIVLAVGLGEKFYEDLFATDVARALGGLAEIASAGDMLRQFIRDQQPMGQRYQDAKAASAKLALKLDTCRPHEATGKALNCDYQITFFGGCTATLRIDESDYGDGVLRPDDIGVRLKGDCEPEALAAIFELTDPGAALPVEISGLKLLFGDNIEFQGKLAARTRMGSERVATTACAKELENATVDFTIAVGGHVTFKPNGVSTLAKCARAYATGKFADRFLPPNLKPNIGELQARIQSAVKEWFDSAAKAGFGKCDPTKVTGWLNVTCTSIALADAQLKNDWKDVSAGWCKTIAAPIQSVLDAASVTANATDECQRALAVNCEAKDADPICSIVVGANYGIKITPPFAGDPVTAAASYTLPDVFKITSCFDGKSAIQQSAGYLHMSLTPSCAPGGTIIKLTGTISLADAFPWKVPPAPVSLSYDLKTGKATADINSQDWRLPLNEALSKAITGQTLGIDGVQIRAGSVTLDNQDRATVLGTLILDWGQHIEVPGFKVIFDLRRGTVNYEKPNGLDSIITDLLRRFASSVSIPGALSVDINSVKTNAKGLPESVTASVTVDAKMFKATFPPLAIDQSGVRFGKPFQISLQLEAEIDIPPMSLSKLRGTIGEKSLALGADATLLQSAIAYVLKAKGDFTIPFDDREDITAIEQMVAFTVVPLGKSTSRINIHEPMMSRTIEIGGALKPVIWLYGEAKINKERLTGNTNFALFGTDLAKADLNADFQSGLVDAKGHANIGIGDLAFVFNGKQFALNPRLQLNGNINVAGFSLSSFTILARLDSAAVKFKVLGISLGFVTPKLKDITGDMLKKLIEGLLSFKLPDLGKALEAILSGNLTINPFSGFGKDAGNGVSNGDGSGSEEGGEGENGGGAVGAYPAAGQVVAEQGPQGTPADNPSKTAAENASQAATEALSDNADKGAQPGGSKALLNPEGKLVMQFLRKSDTISGDLAPPGQTNAVPLLTLRPGGNPTPYFAAVEGDPTRLKIVKTPILLDRDIFVAAEASEHLFLPKEPRNNKESPIKGLCAGTVSEVDLLLFGKDGDASQPIRLPAGLLGLCLEGLKEVANNPVASNLLLGALRVSAMTLTKPGSGRADSPSSTEKVAAPLRSAWFQCTTARDDKRISGLALLIAGELASRIITNDGKGLTYFRMTGFPYEDDQLIAEACQLLATAEPADEERTIDFIAINDRHGSLSAGRMARGELKFDKEWIPLDSPERPLPLPVRWETSLDPQDSEIRDAIERQNEDKRAPSRGSAPDGSPTMFAGQGLCVVNKDNSPSMAESSDMAPFLALDSNDFRFSNLLFPKFSVGGDACGQVDSDQARVIYYIKWLPGMPAMGRFTRQGSTCALEIYWTQGEAKSHVGIKVSDTLCAAHAKTTNLRVFNQDMFLVVRRLRHSCKDGRFDSSTCLKGDEGPLILGGGWSDAKRVVILGTSQQGEASVWGGQILESDEEGKPLRGEPALLKALINRAWESPGINVFADWIERQTDPTVELLNLGGDFASFITKSAVLRLNLKTGKKNEFRFLSNAGLKTKEVIRKALDQLADAQLATDLIDVALIAINSNQITFAIKRADGKWEEHRPNAASARIISGLIESDLTPAFGRAMQQLVAEPGEIKVTRNAKAVLVVSGSTALVVPPGEKACPEQLVPAAITEQDRSKLINLWLQDFAHSLVEPKGKCDEATTLDTKPVLIGSGDAQLTIFNYGAGILHPKQAAHVLAKDGRAFTLVRETDISGNFSAAEQSLLQFAFRGKQLPKKVLLLGKVGANKLRFGFDAELTGLAGPNFVCPFDNPEVFSRVSPVVDSFLTSVNQACQEEAFKAAVARARFARVSSSAGEVDVLTAPRPAEPRSWSVHFGSFAFPQDKVVNANVNVPEGTDDTNATSLLLSLARAWFEAQSEQAGYSFASGTQFEIRRYCDHHDACVAVAFAPGKKSGLFVTAIDAESTPRFWMAGAAGEEGTDPFADLGGEQGAAVAFLREDLDLLAHGDRSVSNAARAFCVVRHEGVTLWPRLSAAGGSSAIRELGYQVLGKPSPSGRTSVFAEDLPTCGWLRELLGSNFRRGLKALLAIGPIDAAPREVWFSFPSKSFETTYERVGMPKCRLASEVAEIDTFTALSNRPPRVACPIEITLFRRVIGGPSPNLSARLVFHDRASETAWVAVGKTFRPIRTSGNYAAYTDAHWRLLEEVDLAADDASVSRMMPLARNDVVRLLVLTPRGDGALLSSRSLQNDVPTKQEVKTIGLPANMDNPVVRAALDALGQRETVPAGIVFNPMESSAVVQFWMVENGLETVSLFRGSGGQPILHLLRMVNGSQKDIDGVMNLLGKADPRMAVAIEEGDKGGKGGTPPFLRISGDGLAAITTAKLLLQTGSNVQTATFSQAIVGLKFQIQPLIGRLLDLLVSDPRHCVRNSCPVGGGGHRFVLLDDKSAWFGTANGSFGHATIIGEDAVSLMTSVEQILAVGRDELFDSHDGVLISLPAGEGFLADQATRIGLVFSPTRSRNLTLRESLQLNLKADASKALSRFDGHLTERLSFFPEGSALGLVKSDERSLFVCGNNKLTILDSHDWTIAGAQVDAQEFCSAIETSSFKLGDQGAWNLTKRNTAFILFKDMDGSFSVRIWEALRNLNRTLTLPFSPISSSGPSLEVAAQNTAFACDDVTEVKAVGGGFWFTGKSGAWKNCKLQVGSGDVPMTEPTLLIGFSGPRAEQLTASVALLQQAERLAVIEGEVLKALAARVTGANACPTIGHVRATAEQGDRPVLLYDPDPGRSCESGLAWNSKITGAVHSLVGGADDIHALAHVVATDLPDLVGTNLFLEKYVEDAGIVVSDRNPQLPTLTVVPFGQTVEPIARTAQIVDTAWKLVCKTNALGPECPKITPLELGQAALQARSHPGRGRVIPHKVNGEPKPFISPVNLFDFWVGAKN